MKRTVLVGLSLGLSLAAFAQKPDPFDIKVGDLMILQSKDVQKEVGITEKLRNKMNEFASAHDKKAKALAESAQKKGQNPTSPEYVKESYALYNELKSNIGSVMTAPMAKRWRELTIQSAGIPALLDGNIAQRIGLSAEQSKKLKSAFQTGMEKFQKKNQEVYAPLQKKYGSLTPKSEKEAKELQAKFESEKGALDAKWASTFRKMQSDTEASMKAVLNAKQLAAFEALKGKPFKASK